MCRGVSHPPLNKHLALLVINHPTVSPNPHLQENVFPPIVMQISYWHFILLLVALVRCWLFVDKIWLYWLFFYLNQMFRYCYSFSDSLFLVSYTSIFTWFLVPNSVLMSKNIYCFYLFWCLAESYWRHLLQQAKIVLSAFANKTFL